MKLRQRKTSFSRSQGCWFSRMSLCTLASCRSTVKWRVFPIGPRSSWDGRKVDVNGPMANPQNQQPSHQAALLRITVFIIEGQNHSTYLGSCHCSVATSVGWHQMWSHRLPCRFRILQKAVSTWGLSTTTHIPTKGSVISLAFMFTYEEGNNDQVIYNCRLFNNRLWIWK